MDMRFAAVFTAIDRLSQPVKAMAASVEHLERVAGSTSTLQAFGNAVAKHGLAIGAAGGAVVAGFGIAAKAASDYQAATTHLQSAIGTGTAAHQQAVETMKQIDDVSTKASVSVDSLRDSWYRAASAGLSAKQSMDAMRASAALAIGTTGSAAAASAAMPAMTDLLTSVMRNFHMGGGAAADLIATATSKLSWHDPGQLADALQYAMPASLAAKMALPQAMSVISTLKLGGLDSSMSGTTFRELETGLFNNAKLQGFIATNTQGGLDMVKTIANIHDAIGGLSPQMQAMWLKSMGLETRAAGGLQILEANYRSLTDAQDTLSRSQGVAAALQAARMKDFDSQFARFLNAFDDLKVSLGTAVLPALTKFTSWLADTVPKVADFIGQHPKIVEAVAAFGGFAMLAGPIARFDGALKVVFNVAKFGVGTLIQIPRAISAIADATKLWTGVQWLLDAALAASGITEIIIAVAALAAGAYLVYRNWQPLEAFFAKLGHDIERVMHPLKGVEHWAGAEVSKAAHFFHHGASGAASGAVHVTNHNTVHLHIDVSKPGGFDPKAHVKAVVDIIDRHMARKARLSFGTP